MNKVYLTGNLAKDVDLRTTQSGKSVARTAIAVNYGYGDNKTTDFFDLVIWNKLAETCEKYLRKGSKILVEGRLSQNRYKDKQGNDKTTTEIVVDNFEFMDSKKADVKTTNDDMPF